MAKPAQNTHVGKRKEDHPLLLSKLSAPVASRYLVTRSQIADRVFQSVGTKVVLVRAPAGFGKTTVMLQLRERYEQEGTACAWLNLDDADNDPPRFLTYFGLSLRNILDPVPGNKEVAVHRDQSASELAGMLMERIARHREPFVLFMDEFESLRSPTILALMAQGIDRLPPGAQVVIGSRSVPNIGLARLRARGQLLEIDPSLLRFSAEEAGDFLMKRRGLALKGEQVQRLHRSTEGWVAALWLASVALERRSNAEEFIAGFAGSNAAIADYLAEDVLGGQPEPVREFLLKTSILDQLTPELCNAVCGSKDSAEQLKRVERANLFLMPVDEDHSAYRYHSLFAGFLQEQLRKSKPEWVATLHRAASNWYLQENRPIPAINHAFASGDLAYAIPLLGRHADDLLGRARLRLLTRWLDGLPSQTLEAYPRLRLIHAWAVTFTRGPREALHRIEGFDAGDLNDPEAVAQLLALRPMLLGMTDRIDESHALALAQLPLIKRKFAYAYGMLAQCLANTSMILGHFADARHYADEARTAQAGRESSFHFALAGSVEGAIDLMQGRLKQATVRLRAAAGVSGEDPVNSGSRNAFPGVLLAEALYEAGDSETAERLLSIFVPLVQDLGLPDHLINAHVLLARILGDRGETEGSIKILADLESAGHRLALPRVVACARLERARGLVMQGDFSAAKDQLQQSGDAAFWQEVSSRCFVANDLSTQAIGQFRWMVRSGAASGAIAGLKQHLEEAEHNQRHRRALKLRILLAEALHRDGQRKPALRALSRALAFAAAEGFVRTFLEEGPSMQALLAEYFQAQQGEAELREDDASNQLLRQMMQSRRAAEPVASSESQVSLAEPLTRKEIQVLELLAQGYSNDAMAKKLFVSESTVRTHLRNINVKLQASSRTQAIVIARRMKLIP